MSRPNRIVHPDLPHHVILRGNNRRRLFSFGRDYAQFIYLLGRGLMAEHCLLNALVLMVNHVHLILTPPTTAALGACVKRFAQRYAQDRNRQRAASGRLFEERFFSKPILTDQQLALTTAYIALNPVRAGLVAHPSEYRWSTYGLHARTTTWIPSGIWTPSPWFFSLGRDATMRAACYRDFVALQADIDPEGVADIREAEGELSIAAERRPNRKLAS